MSARLRPRRGRLAATLLAMAAFIATAGAGAPRPAAAAGMPPIKHAFVIVLENKNFDETFGYLSGAPYLSKTLPTMGALVPSYYGVTHESLGNYVALVSGQGSNPVTQADCQIYTDVLPGLIGANGQALGVGCVYPRSVQTIADQLSAKGLTWKGYMEDMGTACRHPALNSPDTTQTARPGDEYAARHNPFVYFHSVIDSPACARDDVPLTSLAGDLASAATTPNLAFITPNLCNDGHDATCAGSGAPGGLPGDDRFLRTWIPRIMGSPAYRDGGLIAVVFDEAENFSDSTACCGEMPFPNTPSNGGPNPGPGGGRTGAVLLSPYVDPGTVDTVAYNHFTLLRSLEDTFGLGHLGYAALPGGASFGADAFTCFAPAPQARGGKLAYGSLVKTATISRGTSSRPSADVKLWFPGRVTVTVRGVRHYAARRTITSPCATTRIRLPRAHGSAVVTASGFGGSERRTLYF